MRSLLLSEGNLYFLKVSIFWPFLVVGAPAGRVLLHKYAVLHFYSGEPGASGARLFCSFCADLSKISGHIIVNNALFSAEIQRKSNISADYKNIFIIFAAVFNCKEKYL